MKKYISYLSFILIIISCDKTKQVTDNSLKTIGEGADKVKGVFVEPDSIKQKKQDIYYQELSQLNPEYKEVASFFSKSNNPYVQEKEGDIYKIYRLTIDNDGSITYQDSSNGEEIKYFYKTDKNFYIYTFSIANNQIKRCVGVRKIVNDNFKSPAYDLIFENEKLVQEEFIGDVSKNFYSKDGKQYFEIKKKFEDSKIITTYDLGKEKDF